MFLGGGQRSRNEESNSPDQHFGTLRPDSAQLGRIHSILRPSVPESSRRPFPPLQGTDRSLRTTSPLGSLIDFPLRKLFPDWGQTSTLNMSIFLGSCLKSNLLRGLLYKFVFLEISVDVAYGLIKYPPPHHPSSNPSFLLSIFGHFYILYKRPYPVSAVWGAAWNPHLSKFTPKTTVNIIIHIPDPGNKSPFAFTTSKASRWKKNWLTFTRKERCRGLRLRSDFSGKVLEYC